MRYPQAYGPEYGYKYQLLCKAATGKAYEHCDYAKDRAELDYLKREYSLAYGSGWQFKSILLPQRYWKE